MRSPWRMASSTDWVENISAMPAPRSSSSQAHRRWRWSGLRVAVGSSSSSALGRPASAMARLRRWSVPVESLPAGCSANRSRSARAISSEAAASASAAFSSAANRRRFLARRQAGVERGPLGHPADARSHAVGPGDGARGRAGDPGEDRQQRRLAGAVRPDERDGLPAVQLQVDAVQGREVTVEAAQAARHQQRRAGRGHRAGQDASPLIERDCRSPLSPLSARRAAARLAWHRMSSRPRYLAEAGARPGAGAGCGATAGRSSRRRSRWRRSSSSR